MDTLVQLYKDVESSLKGMEIPPCPGVLDQILAESRQEEPDFMRLAALILKTAVDRFSPVARS